MCGLSTRDAGEGDMILQFPETGFAAIVSAEKGQHHVTGRVLIFSDSIMARYGFTDLHQERDRTLTSTVCRLLDNITLRDITLYPDMNKNSVEYFDLELDIKNLQLLTR
jgi:hypothetical protein